MCDDNKENLINGEYYQNSSNGLEAISPAQQVADSVNQHVNKEDPEYYLKNASHQELFEISFGKFLLIFGKTLRFIKKKSV